MPPNGEGAVSKPRMMLGKIGGGAVRLAPITPALLSGCAKASRPGSPS